MAKFQLRVNNKPLEVGWSAKLIAEFEPVNDCGEESFWVKVQSVEKKADGNRYVGMVVDYMTYSKGHGIKHGFAIEFGQDQISEIWERESPRPTN